MMPIMQLVMYSSVIALMWFGGKQIVIGTMQEGDLVGFFTYITQVLSSLMMIGMVFVSLVMVQASNNSCCFPWCIKIWSHNYCVIINGHIKNCCYKVHI